MEKITSKNLNKKKYEICLNNVEAIKKAIKKASSIDIVLVMGYSYFYGMNKKDNIDPYLICRKAIEKGIPLEINFGKIASKIESGLPLDELKKRIPYPSPEFWKIVAEETRIAKENGKDLFVIYGKDAHFPGQLSKEKDYEIAKAIIGENTLEQLHIVTSYKELEAELTKQKKPKKTQDFLRRNFRRTKRY